MSPELSDPLDPIRLAKAGAELEGMLKLSEMERLSTHLFETEGEAEYTLHFIKEDGGRYCIRGRVFAQLQLICQRCLDSVEKVIKTDTNLIVVKNLEEARQVPEEFEPFIIDQGVTLKSLLEDELLLALPTVPRHEIEDCPVKIKSDPGMYEAKKNPFVELSKLQVKNRSK